MESIFELKTRSGLLELNSSVVHSNVWTQCILEIFVFTLFAFCSSLVPILIYKITPSNWQSFRPDWGP